MAWIKARLLKHDMPLTRDFGQFSRFCAVVEAIVVKLAISVVYLCPRVVWPEVHTSIAKINSAQYFSDRSAWKPLRVLDVRAFGSWTSAPKCFAFQDFDRPGRSFGPGYPREWPPDVRGMSVPQTSSLGWFSVHISEQSQKERLF